MAPLPRHVLGRRGPVQAGPLPGCRLRPSALSQCLAKAVEPQGPLLLRAELGAKADIWSYLVWEKSFRTSKLWLALAGEQLFPVFVTLLQSGVFSLSPQDLEG